MRLPFLLILSLSLFLSASAEFNCTTSGNQITCPLLSGDECGCLSFSDGATTDTTVDVYRDDTQTSVGSIFLSPSDVTDGASYNNGNIDVDVREFSSLYICVTYNEKDDYTAWGFTGKPKSSSATAGVEGIVLGKVSLSFRLPSTPTPTETDTCLSPASSLSVSWVVTLLLSLVAFYNAL